MLKLHRLLGTALSVFLLSWFLSGFVMMYHGYPSWSREEALALSPDLPLEAYQGEHLDSVYASINLRARQADAPYQLSLRYEPAFGAHYELRSGGTRERYNLGGELLTEQVPMNESFERVSAIWQDSVLAVDTIYSLDQWTPFDRLREDLPFYRLTLSREGRQVYLSSQDGRVITEHTKGERLWSWVGAIPHWVYFTQLRQNRDLWTWVIIVLSGLGTLMLIGGIYIGVDVYWRVRKSKRGLHSPYVKPSYRWHHIFGTIGGLFMLAWCFSGFMSVVEVSSSLDHEETERIENYFRPKALPLTAELERAMQGVRFGAKEMSWGSIGAVSMLRAAYVDNEAQVKYEYWRVGEVLASPLELSEQEVRHELEQALPKNQDYALELLTAYDGYYLSMKRQLDLPVYRAIPTDNTLPYIYINPGTGESLVLSRSSRIRMWLYNKPHSLRFANLTEYPILREAIMWILLLMGTVVSVTGVLLGVRYVRRRL